MAYLTEAHKIEILIMTGYGDRIRTQNEIIRLFREKYPDLPPHISRCHCIEYKTDLVDDNQTSSSVSSSSIIKQNNSVDKRNRVIIGFRGQDWRVDQGRDGRLVPHCTVQDEWNHEFSPKENSLFQPRYVKVY
ncbi:hypothetical protein ILUMI_13185 [Ignelater luminosus]|uniref:Uncharacterized protein n=1 Tax=Ignelater luminosus TaxID=2038154 RepID=A0A8K0CZ10_IGNLU|nr:hypothetical protein ILUMI_13185 [Ignelater luminosus]